ncbi:MAG: hypothetical protein U9R51_05175 [Actinomycetota bacterium]|nr:hypothetical protein [Actinomycetota bacterium]
MKAFIPLALALALAATACGATEEDSESSPPAVVAGWAEAVEVRDFEAATAAVFEPSMVIVLAAENSLPAAETVVMLSDGVAPAVAAAYWSSFRDGFDAFAGRPISTLNVGASEEVEAGDELWAVVTVRAQEDVSAPVFTRDDGRWLVDLVATLAPGFIEPLALYLESLPDDPDGDILRQAYADVVIPALWAAIEAGGHDDEFTRRALSLIEAASI